MPKRKDRVAPPPSPHGWDLRYATNEAITGWRALTSAAPGASRSAWEAMTTNPQQRDRRQHPLRGTLATRILNGKELEQWQFEVTGAGRVWFCIDDETRVVWMTASSVGHPKQTE